MFANGNDRQHVLHQLQVDILQRTNFCDIQVLKITSKPICYIIVKKTNFTIQCKGQTYKTAQIILLCHKVLCLFCTVTFTWELIAKRH